MSKTVDYYLSLGSPYAYLGGKRLPEVASRTGARFVVKPVKTALVFEASGSLPLPKRPPQRKAYRLVELARWRDHWKLPMNIQPKYFPVDDAKAAQMVIAGRQDGQDAVALANAFMACVWELEKDISDQAVLIEAADAAGFDGKALLAGIGNADVEAEYKANTEEAIARQVFGLPWFVYQDIPYWGQDRIDFLERALG